MDAAIPSPAQQSAHMSAEQVAFESLLRQLGWFSSYTQEITHPHFPSPTYEELDDDANKAECCQQVAGSRHRLPGSHSQYGVHHVPAFLAKSENHLNFRPSRRF